jgi:coenzyme PQQ precursor peptide PqqA
MVAIGEPHVRDAASIATRRQFMTWTTPEIIEVCVGMEITAYEAAEI